MFFFRQDVLVEVQYVLRWTYSCFTAVPSRCPVFRMNASGMDVSSSMKEKWQWLKLKNDCLLVEKEKCRMCFFETKKCLCQVEIVCSPFSGLSFLHLWIGSLLVLFNYKTKKMFLVSYSYSYSQKNIIRLFTYFACSLVYECLLCVPMMHVYLVFACLWCMSTSSILSGCFFVCLSLSSGLSTLSVCFVSLVFFWRLLGPLSICLST